MITIEAFAASLPSMPTSELLALLLNGGLADRLLPDDLSMSATDEKIIIARAVGMLAAELDLRIPARMPAPPRGGGE